MLTFLSLSAREIARGDVFPEITHETKLISDYFDADVKAKKTQKTLVFPRICLRWLELRTLNGKCLHLYSSFLPCW